MISNANAAEFLFAFLPVSQAGAVAAGCPCGMNGYHDPEYW
jgi:hypothetical protein